MAPIEQRRTRPPHGLLHGAKRPALLGPGSLPRYRRGGRGGLRAVGNSAIRFGRARIEELKPWKAGEAPIGDCQSTSVGDSERREVGIRHQIAPGSHGAARCVRQERPRLPGGRGYRPPAASTTQPVYERECFRVGAGSARLRGLVTIRRNPVRQWSTRASSSCPATSAVSHAAYASWSSASRR